jgi:hypothetical protein
MISHALELLLIIVVVVFQGIVGIGVIVRIRSMRAVFPESVIYKSVCIKSSETTLQAISPAGIRALINEHPVTSDTGKTESGVIQEVELLTTNGNNSSQKLEILLDEINMYLVSNRGSVADYTLLRDLTERHTSAMEDDVSSRANIPLYLGFAGTLIGIVIGLFDLYNFAAQDANEVTGTGITQFLSGVALAMVSSLLGLLWSVIAGNLLFANARQRVEAGKNKLLTFFQTALLPKLQRSVTSEITNLQRAFAKFNTDFMLGLNQLTGMLGQHRESISEQRELLELLNTMDIKKFAQANVDILKQLKGGVGHLKEFTNYLESINDTTFQLKQVTSAFTLLLDTTNNFKSIASKLDDRVEDSYLVLSYMKEQMEHLKIFGNYASQADSVLLSAMDTLKAHVQQKMAELQHIAAKENDRMQQALNENRSGLAKLNLLENVDTHLGKIHRDGNALADAFYAEIQRVIAQQNKTNEQLEQLLHHSQSNTLFGWLRVNMQQIIRKMRK